MKKRLTELTIRKAKPAGKTYQIWDSLQRGLALRVQPTGGKSWYCVYSRQGRSRWLRLGPADAIGLADARTLAAEAMLALARGHDPAAEKKAERGAGTFAALHQKYLDQYAKKANRSWQQADALVRRFALPRWGKLQPTSISRADVKMMIAKIEAPILANQTLAAVSAVFSWAVKEEIVAANPCKLVARNATKSRERVLVGIRSAEGVGGVRRRWPGRRHGAEADPTPRPAAGRGRPHAARAFERRLVGNARRAERRLAGHQERCRASGLDTKTGPRA